MAGTTVPRRTLAIVVTASALLACVFAALLLATFVRPVTAYTLELPVSSSGVEGSELVLRIERSRFPMKKLGPLTWGNLETEIRYTNGPVNSISQVPSWRLSITNDQMIYFVSPPPTNQTVLIQMTLTEWLRVPALSKFVRTNRYEWSKPFSDTSPHANRTSLPG